MLGIINLIKKNKKLSVCFHFSNCETNLNDNAGDPRNLPTTRRHLRCCSSHSEHLGCSGVLLVAMREKK